MLNIIPNKFMYSGVGSSDTVPVGDGLYLHISCTKNSAITMAPRWTWYRPTWTSTCGGNAMAVSAGVHQHPDMDPSYNRQP